jgi:hypothetical protein
MLNRLSGASSGAENRIHFSAQCAKHEVMTVRLMRPATAVVAHKEGSVEPRVHLFQQRSLYSIKKVFALPPTS